MLSWLASYYGGAQKPNLLTRYEGPQMTPWPLYALLQRLGAHRRKPGAAWGAAVAIRIGAICIRIAPPPNPSSWAKGGTGNS